MATFAQIQGHERPVGILRRALTSQRLHHSLLFHGPEGVGKRTTALALAATVNCERTARTSTEVADDACGACSSCTRIARGAHPDVRYITLERTVIPIDSVRALREESAARPFEGRRRVFIIDPADRLSHDAQNALLKTLEEPSPSSLLILLTCRPAGLLSTTRSRCFALTFGAMSPEDLARDLVNSGLMTIATAPRAARLAGGRIGAALALDLETHDAIRDEMLTLLEQIHGPGGPARLMKEASTFGADLEEVRPRLGMLTGLVRDIVIYAAGAPAETLCHADVAERLAGIAASLTAVSHDGDLTPLFERTRTAISDLDRNINRRLALETLLVDLASVRAA